MLFHPLSPGVRYSSHLEIPPDAALMLCQPKMLKPGCYLLTGTLAGVSQELALRNTSKTPPLALPGVKHPFSTAGPNPIDRAAIHLLNFNFDFTIPRSTEVNMQTTHITAE